MEKVRIASIGVGLPERKLTNSDLATMVNTTDEWIVSRTGIHERRIAAVGVCASDLAVDAARDCLSKTDVKPELLISSTSTAERTVPNQSCIVANHLGLESLTAFDINAACSGLVYALAISRGMMETLGYRNALVTASEKMSMYTDYTDRASCVLFGDGASAVLLSYDAPGPELVSVHLGVDATKAYMVTMGERDGDPWFWQDGKQVYLFAVSKIIEIIEALMRDAGLTRSDRFHIVPHQANQRMFEAVCERSGLSMDRFVLNLDRFGNTSSASIGIALEEAWRQDRFKPGDWVFLVAFGGGLSWGGVAIRW